VVMASAMPGDLPKVAKSFTGKNTVNTGKDRQPNPKRRKKNTTNEREKGRGFCMTYNNYREEDVTQWFDDFGTYVEKEKANVQYFVYGKEIGESGTPHLQMYIHFPTSRTKASVVKFINKPLKDVEGKHINVILANGSAAQNAKYCMKGEQSKEEYEKYKNNPCNGPNYGKNFVGKEWGTRPVQKGKGANSGKRSDIHKFRDAVALCAETGGNLKDLEWEHCEVLAKYPGFYNRELRKAMPVKVVPEYPLTPWQEQITKELAAVPTDRQPITFIVDLDGNLGKSWFRHDYERKHPNTSVGIKPGKLGDMAFALTGMIVGMNLLRVIFVDCPRSKIDHMSYDFLENLCDGNLYSPKYESCNISIPNVHVCVLMNEEPDYSKLSWNRYKVFMRPAVAASDVSSSLEMQELHLIPPLEIKEKVTKLKEDNKKKEQMAGFLTQRHEYQQYLKYQESLNFTKPRKHFKDDGNQE